jgi:DNA polymerase-3 subunit delta
LERVRFEKGVTASELEEALNTVSFFGKGKFVILSNTEIFKGQGMREDFEKVLGRIPSDSHVVFIESNTDKKNGLFIEISKAGFAYSIDMRKSGDLSRYIANRFKKHKKRISFENIHLFMEYSGSSLTDIEADIEKILLYMGTSADVKKEYIVNLCSGTREYRIYEMTDYIFNKDTPNSLRILNELLTDKTPVQVILISIHNRLREMADLREAMDRGREPVVYRNGRRLADFIIRKMQRQAANFTLGELRESIILAADTDMDIKAGKISGASGVEILVNTLCAV